MSCFGRCSRVANPLTACLTGCGIITTLMGFLTVTTFTTTAATNYVSEFGKYEVITHSVKCIDSTNRGNAYTIPLPTSGIPIEPPSVTQTTIPTLYVVDSLFMRHPYYQLHVSASTSTESPPADIVYTMRYKFMNQCAELGELLVRNYLWNNTHGYVYTRNGDTYPLAFPTYDIVIPYSLGASVMLMGVLWFLGACCSGTPGCPMYNWASSHRLGGGGIQGGSATPASWGTV